MIWTEWNVKCWNRFLSLIKLNNEIWISAKYYKLLKLVRVKAHISVWSRFIIFLVSTKILQRYFYTAVKGKFKWWDGGLYTGMWYVCIVIILPALYLSARKPEFLTFLFGKTSRASQYFLLVVLFYLFCSETLELSNFIF